MIENAVPQTPHTLSLDDGDVDVATRAGKNTMAQISMSAARMVSKFLFVLILARLAGRELLGDYTFIISFSTMFSALVSMGLVQSVVREVAKSPEQGTKMLGNALTITMMGVVWVVPVLVGIVYLMGRPPVILTATALAGVATVLEVMGLQVNAVFNGHERMELSVVVVVVQELAFLILGGIALAMGLSFAWLFVTYVVSRLASLVAAVVIYRRAIGIFRLEFDVPFVRQMLRVSAPFAVQMALGPIYLRIDVLMLSFFQGSAAVGIYEAATNIFYRFNVFARMMNRGVMPILTREYATIGQRIRRYIRALAKYEVVIGVPLTIAGLLLADRLIPFLYGSEFEESVLVFQLLASVTVPRLVNQSLGTALTATDAQGWRSVMTVAAALIISGLNFVLLPRYSFQGAAVTTIVGEIFLSVGFYLVLRRRLSHPLSFGQFVRPLLAGLVMAAVVWATHDAWLPVPLLAGGLAYVISLLAFGTFSASELQVLLRASRLDRLLSSSRGRRLVSRLSRRHRGQASPQEHRVAGEGTVLGGD